MQRYESGFKRPSYRKEGAELRYLVRIILSIGLIFSSLGVGEDANSLVKGLVASLLERLGRRLKVVRGLLVQRDRELGSCLLAVE